MDEVLLSRPQKPLRSITMKMFFRVKTRDLVKNYHMQDGRKKFSLDKDEVDEIPADLEHVYIQRLTVRGAANRSYTYMYVTSKPSSVQTNEADKIIAALEFMGVEYVSTLSVDELVGHRRYVEGDKAATILKHMKARGLSTALGAILDSGEPYLLIVKKPKNSLAAHDRKMVVRAANNHSFVMGQEDDLIRIKLAHGGTLIDMRA